MIKLLRVDHRLVHGQVAMTWTQELDTNCILIASDSVVKDDVRKTTLKLARPAGVKLVIKSIEDSIEALNSGVTDKYRLFIVVESIEDAYRLAKGHNGIDHVNIGGTKPREGADVRMSPRSLRPSEMLRCSMSFEMPGSRWRLGKFREIRKSCCKNVKQERRSYGCASNPCWPCCHVRDI